MCINGDRDISHFCVSDYEWRKSQKQNPSLKRLNFMQHPFHLRFRKGRLNRTLFAPFSHPFLPPLLYHTLFFSSVCTILLSVGYRTVLYGRRKCTVTAKASLELESCLKHTDRDGEDWPPKRYNTPTNTTTREGTRGPQQSVQVRAGTAEYTNPQRTCVEVGRMTRLSACNLAVAMSLQRTSLQGRITWPNPLPTTFQGCG